MTVYNKPITTNHELGTQKQQQQITQKLSSVLKSNNNNSMDVVLSQNIKMYLTQLESSASSIKDQHTAQDHMQTTKTNMINQADTVIKAQSNHEPSTCITHCNILEILDRCCLFLLLIELIFRQIQALQAVSSEILPRMLHRPD